MDSVKDLWGHAVTPGTPGEAAVPGGRVSPLVVVVAVPPRVVLAPHVHHHVTAGQALRVPRPHDLRVLQGTPE